MSKIKKGLLSVVCLCLSAAVLTACGLAEEPAVLDQEVLQSTQQAKYRTVQVELGTYERTTTGNATILYPVKAELTWEKADTFFVESLVTNRQQVKKGDILMQFRITVDPVERETLKLELQRKEETLKEEKKARLAQIENAKTAAEITDETPYQKELAELKVQKLQADYDLFLYQSQYEIGRLEEKLAALRETEEENVLTAPFDGVVESFEILQEGERIETGKVLVTLYSEDTFLLQARNIPVQLRYNMDVTVESRGLGASTTSIGKVVASPNILPASLSQDAVLIALDEGAEKKNYEGNILLSACFESLENMLLVKKGAIKSEDGLHYVNILDENGVHKRFVVTGKNNGNELCILDGLSEGQTLILD